MESCPTESLTATNTSWVSEMISQKIVVARAGILNIKILSENLGTAKAVETGGTVEAMRGRLGE